MEIELIEISGLGSVLKSLRLPFGLEERSSSMFYTSKTDKSVSFLSTTFIDKNDVNLLKRLILAGPEHAKCIRGLNVYLRIKAPVYWWCEMEQYNVGRTRLSSESTMHIDCKNLVGDELIKAKSEIPMGKELVKIDMFNYQCLRNIYFQRLNHRLPEWKTFCKYLEELPYSELITIKNN